MDPVGLQVAAAVAVYVALVWTVWTLSRRRPLRRLVGRLVGRLPRRVVPRVPVPPRRPPERPVAPRRPIELVARDARVLGPRVHHPERGISFVKFAALRHRYDRVLAEACEALGVEHLLGVLEPGEDLDAERARVETLLWLAGLRIDEAV